MVQLAARLRQVLPLYGVDPALYQSELDAIDAIEREDPQRAHEAFEALRLKVALGRHLDLHDRLRETGIVADLPPRDTTGLTLREIDREINALAAALRHARALLDAAADARRNLATLRRRTLILDLTPFERVPFARLAEEAERAEEARRAAAEEARIEERLRTALQRAGKLDPVKVTVPDLTSAACPDPKAAAAALTAAERELKEAEAVNDQYWTVMRALKDDAVRRYKRETARTLERRAGEAVKGTDRAAMPPALAALQAEAERLRRDAAGLAQKAARARRTGGAQPEAERSARSGDLQDYYG